MKKSTIILISVAGAILIISLGFTLFLGFTIRGMVNSGEGTVVASDWNNEKATEIVEGLVDTLTINNVSGEVRIGDVGTTVDQELRTVSGRIRSGSGHNLTATSVSGSIRFVSNGKHLKLNTTSGDIQGEILGLEPSGSVKISSVSGSVELEAFSALDALVELKSASGSVTCEFPLQLISSKRSHLEGRIGKGSIPFHVGTVSGGILLDKL